jgi:hypothetical protein
MTTIQINPNELSNKRVLISSSPADTGVIAAQQVAAPERLNIVG